MNSTGNVGENNTGINTVSGGVSTGNVIPNNQNIVPLNVNNGVNNVTPVLGAQNNIQQIGSDIQPISPIVSNSPVQSVTPTVVSPVTPIVQPVVPVISPAVQTVANNSVQVNAAPITPISPVVQPINPVSQPAVQTPTSVTPIAPINPISGVADNSNGSNVPKLEDVINSQKSTNSVVNTPQETNTNNSKVEINISDDVDKTLVKEKKSKDKKKKEVKNSSNDDDFDGSDSMSSSKAPVIVSIAFVFVLATVFVYYFLVMTPTVVFDKAINETFDSVEGLYKGIVNSDNEKVDLNLKFDMTTNESAFVNNKRLQDIERLNGEQFESDIKIDMKNENVEISLSANRKKDEKTGKPGRTMMDFSIFSVDNNLYIQPRTYYNDQDDEPPFKANEPFSLTNDKIVQADLIKAFSGVDSDFSFSKERIDSFFEIAKSVKNKVIDKIDDNQLKRNIVFKKINDTTTIALKVNCKLGKKEIYEIYKSSFEEYKNDDNFLEQMSIAFGIEKGKVVEVIEDLLARDIVTDYVDVNLYMNLANTKLISLDVDVSNEYSAEINYLNGYYSLDFSIYEKSETEEKGKKKFNINGMYNSTDGIVKGDGFIDNEDTYLKVVFDYIRIEDEVSGSKTGNNLTLKFYAGKEEKDLFTVLDCVLDIQKDADISDLTNFKIENVYSIPDIKAEIINRTPHFIGMELEESEIPRTSLSEEERKKLKGELPLLEAADLLVFQFGFKNHLEFMLDYLLNNKDQSSSFGEKYKERKEETKEETTIETKEEVNETETVIDDKTKESEKVSESEETTSNNTETKNEENSTDTKNETSTTNNDEVNNESN